MKSEINYLIVFDQSELMFQELDKIKTLIGLLDNVEIKGDVIKYDNSLFHYSMTEESIQGGKEKRLMLIDLVIQTNKNEQDIEHLSRLLREIRKLVSTQKGKITPVFDGVSAFYAEKAYPKIHHIENLMRQLYAKFSLVTLGTKWADNIPNEITKTVKNNTSSNPLYDLDFIHISNALFDKYAMKEADDEFFDRVRSLSDEDIEDYTPKSNWIRYFQPLINCNADFLQSKWKKLYVLRNKVAHNKEFTQKDFEEVKKLTAEVEEVLVPAISKMSKIKINQTIPTTITDTLLQDGERVDSDKSLPVSVEPKKSEANIGGLIALGLFGALLLKK